MPTIQRGPHYDIYHADCGRLILFDLETVDQQFVVKVDGVMFEGTIAGNQIEILTFSHGQFVPTFPHIKTAARKRLRVHRLLYSRNRKPRFGYLDLRSGSWDERARKQNARYGKTCIECGCDLIELRADGVDLYTAIESMRSGERLRHACSLACYQAFRNQLSRSGTIYFVTNATRTKIKIGWAKRDVLNRLKELQTGCPEELCVLGVIEGSTVKDEKTWHRRHAQEHIRGEWFSASPRLLAEIHDCAEFFNVGSKCFLPTLTLSSQMESIAVQ